MLFSVPSRGYHIIFSPLIHSAKTEIYLYQSYSVGFLLMKEKYISIFFVGPKNNILGKINPSLYVNRTDIKYHLGVKFTCIFLIT